MKEERPRIQSNVNPVFFSQLLVVVYILKSWGHSMMKISNVNLSLFLPLITSSVSMALLSSEI